MKVWLFLVLTIGLVGCSTLTRHYDWQALAKGSHNLSAEQVRNQWGEPAEVAHSEELDSDVWVYTDSTGTYRWWFASKSNLGYLEIVSND